jgi:hypothetical protein
VQPVAADLGMIQGWGVWAQRLLSKAGEAGSKRADQEGIESTNSHRKKIK